MIKFFGVNYIERSHTLPIIILLIPSLATGSPDWVNAIAASTTTLKVELLFLLLVIVPTAENL
ncbi:hypothetical protein [Nostoc commune]|uniref:hypothetical protein n=1 Tax=Nostoc commune TaxID=1178 RepID=UPI002072BA1E|nr:hypothetical protein [Nostoc commune]